MKAPELLFARRRRRVACLRRRLRREVPPPGPGDGGPGEGGPGDGEGPPLRPRRRLVARLRRRRRVLGDFVGPSVGGLSCSGGCVVLGGCFKFHCGWVKASTGFSPGRAGRPKRGVPSVSG